jgi:hypothetical protein
MSTSDSVRLRVESGGFKFEMEGCQEFVSAEYPKLLATLDGMIRAQVVIRVERLRSQLSRLEEVINELISEIEGIRREEDHTKEQIQKAQEQRGQLLKNLQMATDAYANLLQSTSSL